MNSVITASGARKGCSRFHNPRPSSGRDPRTGPPALFASPRIEKETAAKAWRRLQGGDYSTPQMQQALKRLLEFWGQQA